MTHPPNRTTAITRALLATLRAGIAFDAHTHAMTATQAADWLDEAIREKIAREERITEIEAARIRHAVVTATKLDPEIRRVE